MNKCVEVNRTDEENTWVSLLRSFLQFVSFSVEVVFLWGEFIPASRLLLNKSVFTIKDSEKRMISRSCTGMLHLKADVVRAGSPLKHIQGEEMSLTRSR